MERRDEETKTRINISREEIMQMTAASRHSSMPTERQSEMLTYTDFL